MIESLKLTIHLLFIALLFLLLNVSSAENTTCLNRGSLADMYCDNNHNLLADPPLEATKLIDPETLIVSYVPFEGNSIPQSLFVPLTQYLESCLDRKIIFTRTQSNTSNIYAMRNGRLHISGFSAGSLIDAVNQAGAIPFATNNNSSDNKMTMIVRNDSAFYKLSDLKNKRIAHAHENSLSGHLATFYYLPPQGLIPKEDYKITFAGKHEYSIVGVQSGDFDAAVVSSQVLNLMILNNELRPDIFRIIYQSPNLKSVAFAYAYNLDPNLKKKIEACFFNYSFSSDMQRIFKGSTHFIPINYKEDWKEIYNIKMGE